MRRVVELIKETVDREPDPEAARARQRPINRALAKSICHLIYALHSCSTFILHSTGGKLCPNRIKNDDDQQIDKQLTSMGVVGAHEVGHELGLTHCGANISGVPGCGENHPNNIMSLSTDKDDVNLEPGQIKRIKKQANNKYGCSFNLDIDED